MRDYNAFDILGPIMVGPSSSHTAGACKIARVARKIAKDGFYRVDFHLHGSFAATYVGHGTDKALVGGALGFSPEDPSIKDAFMIAMREELNYKIKIEDLGDVHPNTVKIVFKYEDAPDEYVIGSSIGGGSIVIVNISGMELEYRGEYPTILLQYVDRQGVISKVSGVLSKHGYNIESINTKKDKLSGIVTLTIETDRDVEEFVRDEISSEDYFINHKYVGV